MSNRVLRFSGVVLLSSLTACGLISKSAPKATASYESDGNALCPSDYAPISMNPAAGSVELHSLQELPAGTLTYRSSQFYVEERVGNARSQIHVVHGGGNSKAAVLCVSHRSDSPAATWAAAVPSLVTKGQGDSLDIRWWRMSAEINTSEHSWAYGYTRDGVETSPHALTEDGTARWFKLNETEVELRARIDSGAIGTIHVIYQFEAAQPTAPATPATHHAAPSGGAARPSQPAQSGHPAAPARPRNLNAFERLSVGKYHYVAAYTFYDATIQGERIQLNFTELAGESEARETRNVGLNAGMGFSANLTTISEFEKSGPNSGTFTLRDYSLSAGGGGDYSHYSSNRAAVVRGNIHSFMDLGFDSDLGVDEVPGHPDQVLLTHSVVRDDMSYQVRVLLRRE